MIWYSLNCIPLIVVPGSSCCVCAGNSFMTSSVHDLSDNSEADEQQKHSESQIRSSSPVSGMSHPGITTPVQYTTPQLGAGHAMVLSLESRALLGLVAVMVTDCWRLCLCYYNARVMVKWRVGDGGGNIGVDGVSIGGSNNGLAWGLGGAILVQLDACGGTWCLDDNLKYHSQMQFCW
ncbi:hypothetical protein Patl1_11376 [Pistacia atlantica]|uniref:Uncharacterized protein n=1 Tax=Pistacia atlantica TaxID=434234 RepID=A0ACC1A316_9ROSI|nr:hypothetical protein Patl1_11376 [Pistacia atlantica]